MTTSRDEIIQAAMQLSEADRLAVAGRLLETTSDDLPGLDADGIELVAELDRRSGDETGSISWEKLRNELPPNE